MLDPTFRFAIEFRNLTWLRQETWDLLKAHDVAYTNVDEPLLPPEMHLTTDFAYFRWHARAAKAKTSGLTTATAMRKLIRGFPKSKRPRAKSRKLWVTSTTTTMVAHPKTANILSKSWGYFRKKKNKTEKQSRNNLR